MNSVGGWLRRERLRVRDRLDEAGRRLRRITPAPLVLRLVVSTLALGAMLLGWSAVLRTEDGKLSARGVPIGPGGLVMGHVLLLCILLLLAVLAGLLPDGWMPSVAMLTAAGAWLVGTAAHHQAFGFWSVAVLAGLLYLVHTLAALAAALPSNVILPAGVLRRHLARAGVVLALTTGFAVAMWAVAARFPTAGRDYLVASLVAAAIAAGVVLLLAVVGRAAVRRADHAAAGAAPALRSLGDESANGWRIKPSASPPGTGLENQ